MLRQRSKNKGMKTAWRTYIERPTRASVAMLTALAWLLMTAPATLAEVPVDWQLGMQAAASLAALNLKRTEVRATVNGFVSNLNLAKGDYASPAKPVLAVIDSDSYRVDAYFEETKIPQIRVGSPVDIHLMNGAAVKRGCVESIARGITDQDNRDGPELVASVNPTLG